MSNEPGQTNINELARCESKKDGEKETLGLLLGFLGCIKINVWK